MTELEKERLIKSHIDLYRDRVRKSKMDGEEFLEDFLTYLEVSNITFKLKEGEDAKSRS